MWWDAVRGQDPIWRRNHALAVGITAVVTLLSLAVGLETAGPLLAVDLAVAGFAWFGGLSAGAAAALTAALVARLASPALAGAPFAVSIAILATGKWLFVAAAATAFAARLREDAGQMATRDDQVERLEADGRKTRQELRDTQAAAAEAHALLREEADRARQQLTMLQSVTDPALNVLGGGELVSSLLDRLRVAVDADGVAVYHHHGLRGRIFAATDGVAPSAAVRRLHTASGYQAGRTMLIHNDAQRVAETSLCQWPPDVASLIFVPVVHAGRLQLVVEVASRQARRSTEWELALIQVVAERAAGLLRADASFDTGAVA